MFNHIRYMVTVMALLTAMPSVHAIGSNSIMKHSHGKPSEKLINPDQYIPSDDLKWLKQEISLYSSRYKGQFWCGAINTLSVAAEYRLCSQSKDGSDWMCTMMKTHLPDDESAVEYVWCHEYQFVAGTNIGIFVHEDDGRYLRTESAFVPQMKSHGTGWIQRHHSAFIGCIILAAFLLNAIGYFLYKRGFAQVNEPNEPGLPHSGDNV